jgi:hypothetical protein
VEYEKEFPEDANMSLQGVPNPLWEIFYFCCPMVLCKSKKEKEGRARAFFEMLGCNNACLREDFFSIFLCQEVKDEYSRR